MTQKILPKHVLPEQPFVKNPTFLQRLFNFRVVLFVLIISFAILTYFAKTYAYFWIDLYITKSIQSINLPLFDWLMQTISSIGNFEWGVVTVTGIMVFLGYIGKRYDAGLIGISTVGAFFISIILKALVSRPRPDPELINQVGNYLYSDSFPSGHVLHYMGLYGFLLLLTYSELKHSIARTVICTSLIIFIILGGVSRIYLGAHWFSDTLGSYLIGSVWLILIITLYKYILIKFKKVK